MLVASPAPSGWQDFGHLQIASLLGKLLLFPPFPIPGHFPAEPQPQLLSPLLDVPASRDLAQWQNFCYPLEENLRSL